MDELLHRAEIVDDLLLQQLRENFDNVERPQQGINGNTPK